MDRRSLLRAVALGGLGTLAGCGVSSRGGVVVDGPGPSGGLGGAAADNSAPPALTAARPDQVVQNFLLQGAGDPGDLTKSIDAYRSYMTDGLKSAYGALNANTTKLVAVWYDPEVLAGPAVTQLGGSGYSVSLPVVVLGVLNRYCVLAPPAATQKLKLEFTLTRDVDGLLRISAIRNAPSGAMLISSDALANYYDYRSLYFWDLANECLVPDVRYVPVSWDEGTTMKWLVEGLLVAGPSDWLSSQVIQPNGALVDNAATSGQNVIVNLTRQVLQNGQSAVDPGRVISQLTWTLYDEAMRVAADADDSPIKLKIDSTDKKTGGLFRADNFTAVRAGAPEMSFAILDHERKVRRLPSRTGQDTAPIPFLDTGDPATSRNKDVEWVAMIRDRRHETDDPSTIAVVHRDKNNNLSLKIGAGQAEDAPLRDVGLSGKSFLRPGFFDERMIIVVKDGHLYTVPRDSGSPQQLVVPGIDGPITAFALAPDGRRMAVATAGGLYLVALARTNPTSLTAGPPIRVATILDSLTGIAFTGEDRLVISGTYSESGSYTEVPRIVEMSIDGGLIGRRGDSSPWLGRIQGTPTITSLAAHPAVPRAKNARGRVFYTANGASWEAENNQSSDLTSEMIKLGAVPNNQLAVNAFFLE